MFRSILLFAIFLLASRAATQTQDSIPTVAYQEPLQYEIGGIVVSGAYFSDEAVLIAYTGLEVGKTIKIPGNAIQDAIRKLLKLRIFSSVEIQLVKTIGDIAFLEIVVQEQARLSHHSYEGVKKSWHGDLNDKLNPFLVKGSILTTSAQQNAVNAINAYFIDKGYFDVTTTATTQPDTTKVNALLVRFKVDVGKRIKVAAIDFVGNDLVKDRLLLKRMKNTKTRSSLLKSSKFIPDEYKQDKQAVEAFYQSIGHSDAKITADTMWRNKKGELNIQMRVQEGRPFYFGNIVWKGSSKFTPNELDRMLRIKKGDLFNDQELQERLKFSDDGSDISTAYMDDGYLFFNVDAIETSVREDTIDLEIRIFEGAVATINQVTINGNTRTHEHVIRRELRTKPGDKFSRSDIIRTQRELINLGYFNPENLGINTPVNPESGTVDIEYTVEEKPSDQLELSAGWGGRGQGVIGTLGFTFNNFSLRNLRNPRSWTPLPQGDGQRVSIRGQSNGRRYQSVNLSFTDPWLGGKKPNSFTVAGFLNRFSNGVSQDATNSQEFYLTGLTVSLGTRLRWPDDFFIASTAVNLQQFSLNNWGGLFVTDDGSSVSNGIFNNFSITQQISRNSIDNPIFPTRGSNFSLTLKFTPPYSLFSNKDYQKLDDEERFQWIEYHKWRFDMAYYTPIVGKLVLKVGAKMGFLGYYNEDIGYAPFERFQLGGDGLNNQNAGFQGTDIVSLRGYEVEQLESNLLGGRQVATPIFQKVNMEVRFPLSTNPSSTIYVLAFAEAGNSYRNFETYNPFVMKRSYGIGARVFLPMFGTLGFDYGIGVDGFIPGQTRGNFNIILGFEPD